MGFAISKTLWISVGCLAVLSSVRASAADQSTDVEAMKYFEMKVRPVLAENCFECHGAEKQKHDLRLDNLGYILRGGKNGPAIVPGEPEKSQFFHAISYEDKDLQMPPDGKKLSDEQIADLKKWIAIGAPWPESEVIVAKPLGEFSDEDRAWWSFQPVRKISPPALPEGTGRVHTPVDQFVLAKLKESKLTQAPEATRLELVRRAYYDLHGISPTPEQVKAFVEDPRPDAYEHLIDELLESPLYGVRWAQHWLDLARYAESDGYRGDDYRPNAWPYRDYVIRSFNEDKPYDRFVREQLAGDEINPDDPNVLVATGFLRHGIYEWNQRDAEGQRELIVNEMTDVTGELFLGLSFACAKCHDHKFDPILQKDYYRLRSFFEPVQWRDDLVLATPDEKVAHQQKMTEWETASQPVRAAFDGLLEKEYIDARKRATEMFPDEVKAMIAKPDDQRTPYEKQINYLVERQVLVEHKRAYQKKMQAAGPEALALKVAEEQKPAPLPVAFVATDVGIEAPPTLLKSRRGAENIKPGFLSLLEPVEPEISPLTEKNSTGRRSALANWITNPENPLSTRVIVNRVWQYHFGKGLSPNSSDFGRLGAAPTHPELLDWLTSEFVKNGWSVKWLHRQIMKSATYRQSKDVASTDLTNQVDPANRLLWRMSPQRMDAEQVRDTILQLSGELKLSQIAGPPEDATKPVRSILTRKRRNSQDEFLARFDAAPGFLSVAQRDSTTTALQSLLMINGEWPLQRARVMAGRLLKESKADTNGLVQRAFEMTLARPPSDDELKSAAYFIEQQQELIEKETPPAPPVPVDPIVDAKAAFANHALVGEKSVTFKPASNFEKLKVKTPQLETSEFTLEAVIYLDATYPDASVRTIASRWNGDPASKGWALGVTGKASKYKPNNLILQLSGEDFQNAVMNEVLPSDLSILDRTPYYVAAVLSNELSEGQTYGGSVTFYVKNLADPAAPLQKKTVQHGLVSGYVNSERSLVIGGRDPGTGHFWNGEIGRVVMSNGRLPEDRLLINLSGPGSPSNFDATAKSISDVAIYEWAKPSVAVTAAAKNSPRLEALGDLFHALINSNEFLYLP